MSNRFKFTIPKKSKILEKDPESIFRELQIPSIKGLWSQQADILRDYYSKSKDKSDVAIELPTGTGKTLIGLLIAEYRRRCKEERVLYLCPTRQLATQVFNKAQEYGIPASLMIGPQANYSALRLGIPTDSLRGLITKPRSLNEMLLVSNVMTACVCVFYYIINLRLKEFR